MKSYIKKISFICCILIISDAAIAQVQAGTSDVSISAVTITAITKSQKVRAISDKENPETRQVTTNLVATDTLKCSITVENLGNATAFGKLVVVLPVGVIVQYASLPGNGKVVNERGVSSLPGYVEFDHLLISANQSGTFEFTFTKSAQANNVSAFAFSSVPDANAANNFKTGSY